MNTINNEQNITQLINLNNIIKQPYSSEVRDKFKACEDLDICMKQLESNSKLAVAISYEHASHGQFSDIYCFKEPEIVHKHALKFLLPRNSSHLNNLNKFIKMTATSGLIKKWYSDSHIQPKYREQVVSNNQITMEKSFGLFLILGTLLLLTICIFFVERFVHRRLRTLNPYRFWVLLEMCIDPYRHFMLENKWN